MLEMYRRAIEDGFPIGFVSQIAELESWRKEINRPISYIHKWWAKRLGSVFRAIIIASCIGQNEDLTELFYSPIQFKDKVLYDPFMGSGVTIFEGIKLGCKVIGRDINPVSYIMVSSAVTKYSLEEVLETYKRIEREAGERIKKLYTTTMENGEQADVLYYFWVKAVSCPFCSYSIDLFKSRVFVKDAYPAKRPAAKSVCPQCYAINDTVYNSTHVLCDACEKEYNPNMGVFEGSKVVCPSCKNTFQLINVVRKMGKPLPHKMYAKMVLYKGQKLYLPICEHDYRTYSEAEEMLQELKGFVPRVKIEPGYNTNQVLNYNYYYWHEMFNARQLASLALLVSAIQRIENTDLRRLFACLLSGTLEFNNMFASFKGEGTGAVRHMFSHHILKPELTPLEANVWGTPKSSGSFSTLFKNRILRALQYKANPFEIKVVTTSNEKRQSRKVFGLSQPINHQVVNDFSSFSNSNGVYLSIGDSSYSDIATESVDLIVTDPPFFDNVHYSQLADFFYVWLRQVLGEEEFSEITTRSPLEVQNTDSSKFAGRLKDVFQECSRILKNDGLLVFTYHHSRMEGWTSIYSAVRQAGFYIIKTHPVKSEMVVSVPIQQAKEPISFDLIIVCRKNKPNIVFDERDFLSCSVLEAKRSVQILRKSSLHVSLGDAKIILMGCILSRLSGVDNYELEKHLLASIEEEINSMVYEVLGIPKEGDIVKEPVEKKKPVRKRILSSEYEKPAVVK